MTALLTDPIVIFFSVFTGLFLLWSAARVMHPWRTLTSAAIAGAVSAIAALIITALATSWASVPVEVR
jgi:hypothetical protein